LLNNHRRSLVIEPAPQDREPESLNQERILRLIEPARLDIQPPRLEFGTELLDRGRPLADVASCSLDDQRNLLEFERISLELVMPKKSLTLRPIRLPILGFRAPKSDGWLVDARR